MYQLPSFYRLEAVAVASFMSLHAIFMFFMRCSYKSQ